MGLVAFTPSLVLEASGKGRVLGKARHLELWECEGREHRPCRALRLWGRLLAGLPGSVSRASLSSTHKFKQGTWPAQ